MDKNSPNYAEILDHARKIKQLGARVIVADAESDTPIKTGARYLAREAEADLLVPSNFSFDWDWVMAHFDTSASEASELIEDGIVFVSVQGLKVIAVESKYNKAVDGLTIEEVEAFLSAVYHQEVTLLYAGKIRQNKGRDRAVNKIKSALDK